MTPLLEVQQVSKAFRGLRAVSNVSLSVELHTISALIGPNGAVENIEVSNFEQRAHIWTPAPR